MHPQGQSGHNYSQESKRQTALLPRSSEPCVIPNRRASSSSSSHDAMMMDFFRLLLLLLLVALLLPPPTTALPPVHWYAPFYSGTTRAQGLPPSIPSKPPNPIHPTYHPPTHPTQPNPTQPNPLIL